jgi:hypothetical protein
MTIRRRALLAAILAVAGLYLAASLRTPVGAVEDDALQLGLARGLAHGSFSFPDGSPATDPLPGFALLLLLPAGLAGTHWALLRLLALAAAPLALWATWRLARELLRVETATAVAALVALNPYFLERSVLLVPDAAYLALTLALTRLAARPPDRASIGAALACLLRPLGALHAACVALALGARSGARRAARFALPAFLPLGLWLARNRLVSGGWSGYSGNLASQAAVLADPGPWLAHALGVVGTFLGEGMLCAGLWLAPGGAVLAGLAVAVVAGIGAARLLRGPKSEAAFVCAAYSAAVLFLHLTWLAVYPRYVVPVLPFLWILVAAALEPWTKKRPRLAAAACVLLAAAALRRDADYLRQGSWSASVQPRTMAWLRENTPAGARIEALCASAVTLFTGRMGRNPDFDARSRDEWLAEVLRTRTGYVYAASAFKVDGFLPLAGQGVLARHEDWLRSTPYARLARRDEEEGSAVYAIEHPDPARYLRAWDAYAAASNAARRGRPRAYLRRELEEALRLEPRLAAAWGALGAIEDSPQKRAEYFARAAAEDPTSPLYRVR